MKTVVCLGMNGHNAITPQLAKKAAYNGSYPHKAHKLYNITAVLKIQCFQYEIMRQAQVLYVHSHNTKGVVILLILRNQRACICSKDWRYRKRQSFSRMLLSQKSKTSGITSPTTQ
jgi:hypothetical protein